jgi:excisionase family DNA binding protein
MTIREAADYLKRNPATLYRLVERGQIPAFRIGGMWRFRLSDLEAWVAGTQQRNSKPR